MPDYRAYFVGREGRFAGVKELDCDSDALAIERAQELMDGRDLELWERARFIRKFLNVDPLKS
jgi:hypothetical protein